MRGIGSEQASRELGRIVRQKLGEPPGLVLAIKRRLQPEGMFRSPITEVGMAAFILGLTCSHLKYRELGPVARRVTELAPREQTGAGGALCARLAARAGADGSLFLLPGPTLLAGLSWLVEQLAQPDGAELAAALADGDFALRVTHFGGPFGPVASVALRDGGGEVSLLYAPRSIDWHTPRLTGVVPSYAVGIDLITEIAGLLREAEPLALAQAA